MGLHVCNECEYKLECPKAYSGEMDLWCRHPSEFIRKQQDDRFTKDHENDWGHWVPM